MTTVKRRIGLLARLEEIVKMEVPYQIKTGNDLKRRGHHTPYQILKDGKVEVIVNPEADRDDRITLPFVDYSNEEEVDRDGEKGFRIDILKYGPAFMKLGVNLNRHFNKYDDTPPVNNVLPKEVRAELREVYGEVRRESKKNHFIGFDDLPLRIHAIYDNGNNATHYFLLPNTGISRK